MAIKLPERCIDCRFSCHYHDFPFSRNPHWCCELVFHLLGEDYSVVPDTVDDLCPLRNSNFVSCLEAYAEFFENVTKWGITTSLMKDEDEQ